MVAMIGSMIVGFEWFSEASEHLEAVWGMTIAIPRNFVYAYDGYVDAAHRNSGIWLRFKGFLGEWMSCHDKSGIVTFVDYGNFPSLNTHRRFGFVSSSTVLAVKVLRLSFFRQRRAPRSGPHVRASEGQPRRPMAKNSPPFPAQRPHPSKLSDPVFDTPVIDSRLEKVTAVIVEDRCSETTAGSRYRCRRTSASPPPRCVDALQGC
jgi:hypothetical protein